MTRINSDTRASNQSMQRSIAGRLLFWFLVIALIPCAILTAITARIATRALENSVRNNLVQIATAKAGELESYALERVRDGTALARGPSVIRAANELAAVSTAGSDDSPAQQAEKLSWAALEFEPYLGYVAKSFDYSQLLLIDPRGRILFSLEDAFPVGSTILGGSLASSEIAMAFDRSRTLLQSEISGFQTYGGTQQPLAFVTSPIFDEGRVIGVLAMGMGPQRIWQVLSDLNGLGETGEIVTGQRNGENVMVTSPLRHVPDAAFKM